MNIKISIVLLLIVGFLVTLSAAVLSRFEAETSGIIIGKSSTAVTVRQHDGQLKIYELNPEKLASCGISEVWPDCLPKL